MLLDHDHRGADLAADADQHLRQAVDHGRLKSFRDLVKQQHVGLGHQRAGDDQHLLLAARQGPGALVQPLRQHRKPAADLLEQGLDVLVRQQAEPEIVAHRQVLEQRVLLRHVDQPHLALQMWRHPRHVLAREGDAAAPRRQKAHDRLEQRGLAHAVLADDRERLGLRQRQADIADDPRRTIAAGQRVDLKDRGHARSSACGTCWPV